MTDAPFFTDIAHAPKGEKTQWATCEDGVKIRITTWKNGDKGTVIIFPGRTEFIEKYGPTAQSFIDRGYSVAIVDWRGQGLADRVATNHQLGHVKRFSDYQLDVLQVLDVISGENLPEPNILVAHSMGGCIGLRALHNGLNIQKVIFSAPMWGIYIAPVLKIPAKLISSIGPYVGLSNKFSPNTRAENYVQIQGFEDNTLTNDAKTYAWLTEQLDKHPELGIGGPSINWLHQALMECASLRKAPPPKTECLCFLGTQEAIVSPQAIKDIIARWPTGKLVEIDGAQHEIFMEEPHVLAQAWAEIDRFLSV